LSTHFARAGDDDFPLSQISKRPQTVANKVKGVKRQPDQGGNVEISDRGFIHPIFGVATATVITGAYQLISGHFPDPISIANLYLVGLGLGLVIARIGRLGPFGGFLGSPWHEARIEEVLTRETARARQYGRDLSVVAVKPLGKSKFDIRKSIRATDELLVCHNNWYLVVLPETDHEGASLLLRRICGTRPVVSAQTTLDAHRPRQRMDAELFDLLSATKRPKITSIADAKATEQRALAS
jgi:hypothetical protein